MASDEPSRVAWIETLETRRRVLSATGLIAAALAGCTVEEDGETDGPGGGTTVEGDPDDRIEQLSGSTDPADVVYAASMDGAEAVEVTTDELGDDDYAEIDEEPPDAEEHEFGTINPALEEMIEERPDDREPVVIAFEDDFEMPRFPDPVLDEPRDSTANQDVRERTDALIAAIEERRAPEYEEIAEVMENEFEVEIRERFWLVKAVLAEVTLRDVPGIADLETVQYVEPDEDVLRSDSPDRADPSVAGRNPSVAGEAPSGLAAGALDVEQGRNRIDSDPYFALDLDDLFIGLVDTGVHDGHDVFTSPSNLGVVQDCTDGDCDSPAPDDPGDHGTGLAGVMAANDSLGGEYRGITEMTLDVFGTSVVDDGSVQSYSTSARIRGFEDSVKWFDRVIGNAVGNSSGPKSAGSKAADNAYHAGATVSTSNGNGGPNSGTVGAPANAPNALGIGAYSVQNGNQYNSQSRGPTSDGRTKPEVQAPMNARTASSNGTSALRRLCCTSGAAPFGAGAAALLNNWFRQVTGGGVTDPGQVNAQMILSGQGPSIDDTTGAGRIELPTNGWAHWGKVTPGPLERVDVTIEVESDDDLFDAALWWPDSMDGALESAFLTLIDPNGSTQASSTDWPGSFQRARVENPRDGTWTLRVKRVSTNTGSNPVYWAAHRE